MKNYNIYKILILTTPLIFGCKQVEILPFSEEIYTSPTNTEPSTISLTNMDKGVKPYDDFFQYSNGTWVKNNPVPASESSWGSFNELEQNNNKKLIAILDDFASKANNSSVDTVILGNYYASFIDMDKRNSLGLTPIQEDIRKIQKITSKSDIIKVISEHHIMGIGSLFSFGVGQDLKNVDMNISYLGQGGIGLPSKDYYLEDYMAEIVTLYNDHIAQTFTLLSYGDADARNMANAVVNFEKKLAESMMGPAEMRIPELVYNKYSKKEAILLFGKLDFDSYLSNIGSSSFDTVVISQPEFIKNIANMLETESLEDWKHYLTWNVVNHYAGHLDQKFVDQNFNFYGKVLSGTSEMKPIKEQAIDEITNQEFGELLGKAFVSLYFSKEAQNKVNEMVDNLLIVFRDRISNLEWMSEETKKEALNKLNSIGRKLGFPDKWEDYSGLRFTSNNYVDNLKAMALYSHKKNMAELDKPVDKSKWGMPAHMVNAYYHPLLNEIAFPAGIMQAPFFDENAEDAVNYGRIGMVIGHEFTHGFDDMGSKFAADGSFRNWWTDEDKSKFEGKTGTLGETFSAFCPIEGHCVNPDLTMGENIADLGGLTMAYHAYTRTDEFKSGESREGFTPAQRFFIAYAQLWKINYTEEELKNRIANDPHSPGMYRVNGPLKNCPEFFDAFSIEEGSPMRNPKDKISRIW
jgi:putative endopeptidase